MKFYLSSYSFGDDLEKFKKLIPLECRIGVINNAKDVAGADPAIAARQEHDNIVFLKELGYNAESLDLKDYFGKKEALKEKLDELRALWVMGGNTFVLRQAMHLSGFDELFQDLLQRDDFIYAGYSAGICILCESLKPIDQVDDPYNYPYPQLQKTIWEGLAYFNYILLPHYDSNHVESELAEKEVQRCIDNKWLFKALRDGEVIIIQ